MKQNKTIFKQVSDRYYKGEDGRVMRLNEQNKMWCLFNTNGVISDTDLWRYDLAERNGIQLKA